ncbi:MAG: glutathione S-transferase family protein [Parvibaculum sp.]
MTIKLYDLAATQNRRLSPFCWRIKYALAHKGLAFETVPLGFSEIRGHAGSDFKTVPSIEDKGRLINDSWAIADYLDAAYPDHAPLFASTGERAAIRFFDNWFGLEIMNRMFGLYVLDIHNVAFPQDHAYFRESREKRLGGMTLEAFTRDREARLPELRHALRPLRATLAQQPWLGGETPNYADYIALGGFLWVASVNTLPPLEQADTLNDWLSRGFALYGGIARDAKRHPLSA